MVAIVIGLFLLGGVTQVYLVSKQTYRFQEDLARLQESGRFALEILTKDLRMAGYIGCTTAAAFANTIAGAPGDWRFDFSRAIYGYDNGPSGFPSEFQGDVHSGTDSLVVMRGDSDQSYLVKNQASATAPIELAAAHNLAQGDAVLVTDCVQSALFRKSGTSTTEVEHATGTNCDGRLGGTYDCDDVSTAINYSYGPDAKVLGTSIKAYYVGDSEEPNVPALFRERLLAAGTTQAEELVQGVENLQVLFGVDTDLAAPDGVANQYKSASAVSAAEWPNVVSVRIALLLRSANEVASSPQNYWYQDASHAPGDRYLRREFAATVRLRNRGLL
jgi:type IV pilus assembly protein PilW